MNKKPNINPCPLCGHDCRMVRISRVNGGMSEWAVECMACAYVSAPAIGRERAAEKHNQERATA